MKSFLTLIFIIFIISSLSFIAWKLYTNVKYKKKINAESEIGRFSNTQKQETLMQKIMTHNKKLVQSIIIGAVLFFVSIMGYITIPNAMYTVNAGEVAVVKTYGQVTDIATPGLHMRNIFTQTYELYDTKVQQIKLDKWIYVQDEKQITQAIQVLATVQFQINEADVKNIASEYGSLDALKNRLEVILLGSLESSSSGIVLETLITGAGKLTYQEAVVNLLTGPSSEVQSSYYLNFRNIVIQEFVLEQELEAALMKIRIAEAEKAAAQLKYEQETLKVVEEGKQAVQRAKDEAEAAKVKADGDAAVLEIITEAEVKKITAIAEAEAQAIVSKLEQLIETLTQSGLDADLALAHIEYLEFIARWDGKLPETVIGDLASLFEGLF